MTDAEKKAKAMSVRAHVSIGYKKLEETSLLDGGKLIDKTLKDLQLHHWN
jgi:hypothetical protein